MRISTLLSLIAASAASTLAADNTTMWYDKPADGYGLKSPLKAWEKENQNPTNKPNPDQAWEKYALPLGNGFMGAMLYGGVQLDRIQINENSLWRGGPGSEGWKQNLNKPDAHLHLDEIRKALLAGDKKKAQALSTEHLRGLGPNDRNAQQVTFGRYQTFGEILVETDHKEKASNYRRQLDLATAVNTVTYQHEGAKYTRTSFCSNPDRCLVLNYAGDKKQSLKLKLNSPHEMAGANVDGTWKFAGKVVNNGLELDCTIAVKTKSGKVTINENGIEVTDSLDTTFVVVLNTNYAATPPVWRGEAASAKSAKQLSNATKYSFTELKERHIADHKNLHGRVSIDLGKTAPEVSALPTDQRMKLQKKKGPDHDLEELYFQFGRYLLIASSREGSLPANLQGLWGNEMVPAWRSDYHLNINLQMNYWPAGPCNLIECQRPLIDYTETLSKVGSNSAKAYFNADGWTANLASNIWGYTAPNPGKNRPRFWAFFPMAGAWLTTHTWEQYAFEGDEKYLREKCWPIMKGTAQFLNDSLYKLPTGEMSSTPSWSPEHGPVSKGTTCDIAMAREALKGTLETARILKIEDPELKEWKQKLDTLVPHKIGKHGQLQEWYEDIDNPKDKHRHLNHLFGLYPGSQISLTETPKLAAAALKTLHMRGDGATGWSMGWKLNFWARAQDGDHAYILMRNLFKRGTNPNLLDVHPPFQIDGNFGGCAGIAEMLIQSRYVAGGGDITLLPALPKEWHTGSFNGLRARGSYTVDMTWKDAKATSVSIKADKAGTLKLLINGETKSFDFKAGETKKVL